MTTQQPQDFRDHEIKIDRAFYQLFGGAVLILIGIGIGAVLFSSDGGYTTNLYTEGISVALTIFVLNIMAERRENRRRIEELKAQLVREAGSRVNDVALNAVEEIAAGGWLEGENSILQHVRLRHANLENIRLVDTIANLTGVNLYRANLKNAHLAQAIITRADLESANLQSARLWSSDLSGANLTNADLRLANLSGANLKGAKLTGAKLAHANIAGAQFDHNTTLPDGSKWTPEKHQTCWRKDYGAVSLNLDEWYRYERNQAWLD
ncbi:MAG: pentapeptide repeat-containing protein [bacterium]|nr:pentapeptide repeat-containing protein [bacterium]